MLNFFYDSLDTLKKVKKPTTKEIIELTILVFVAVILGAIIFAIYDGVFGELYKMIYNTLIGV